MGGSVRSHPSVRFNRSAQCRHLKSRRPHDDTSAKTCPLPWAHCALRTGDGEVLKISDRRRTAMGRLRALRRDDSGLSLMEMVVAFGVLTVFAVALGITLVNGLDVSKASRERVAAANLASREIEIARNKFGTSD